MNAITYIPSVTAISRKDMSVPMRYLFQRDMLGEKILDFACGKGDDVRLLKTYGYDIKGYDKYIEKYNITSLLDDFYDTVTCNYMFNVIYDWGDFYNAKSIIENLGKDVFVSVRADVKAIKPNWQYDIDAECWWTGKSYQRFYTPETVREHFGLDTEIINANSSFILFKMGGVIE